MYEGSWTFGGVEVVNHARTLAYARSLLAGALTLSARCVSTAVHNPATYASPSADPAPWYDASRPETAGFCGLWVERVVGLDDPWAKSDLTQSPSGGGRLGGRRRQARVVTMSGIALGTSPAAVQAGLEWLARVFSTDAATTSYDGLADLAFYSAAPPQGQVAADYARTLTRVLVTEGPTVGGWIPGGYGCEVRVEFTAEKPEIHWSPTTVAAGPLAPTGKVAAEYFCCHELEAMPGITPPPPAGAPSWRPFREPWWTSRVSTTISHNKPWDLDVGFTVYAGASELKNGRITLYRLKSGQSCPTPPVDLAVECGQIETVVEIPWIPAGSRLKIDAARRRVTLTTSGGDVYDGRRYVAASQNGPLRYPVIPAGAHSACLVFAQDHAAASVGVALEAVTTTRRSLSVG